MRAKLIMLRREMERGEFDGAVNFRYSNTALIHSGRHSLLLQDGVKVPTGGEGRAQSFQKAQSHKSASREADPVPRGKC